MFAPWCPTCARRMLLGPRRVESMERGPAGPRVVLRCFCSTLLVWSADAERVGRPAGPTISPAGAADDRSGGTVAVG